jgi:hypothetical protein
LLLLVVCLAGTARGEEVQPNAPSSHEAYLKELEEAPVRSRREIIDRFDAFWGLDFGMKATIYSLEGYTW